MGVFSNKPTFNDRLKGIKSIFNNAYNEAVVLNSEMVDTINSKKSQIEFLETEISSIEEIKSDNERFMNNIENFL